MIDLNKYAHFYSGKIALLLPTVMELEACIKRIRIDYPDAQVVHDFGLTVITVGNVPVHLRVGTL